MVSNKEKLKWLKANCTDSDGDISLKGLDAPELYFDFRSIKAKEIYNSYQEAEEIYNNSQKAEEIYNNSQKAEEIDNNSQKAEEIDNSYQIIVSKKAKRIKELEESKNKIEQELEQLKKS